MLRETGRADLASLGEAQSASTVKARPVSSGWQTWVILLSGIVAGLIVAMLWRADIVDRAIGMTVADTIVPGSSEKGWTVANAWVGILFAVAAGLATTFTACNCVVFSCLAPLSAQKGLKRTGVGSLLLWMSVGVVAVTAVYGVVGALLEQYIPSLSTATLPVGNPPVPVRLLQSSGVFVALGLLLVYWGLVSLQLAKNPLQNLFAQRAWALPLALGVMVGFFTVGRPYPLFRTLFQYSSGTGNPLLAGLLVALQGLCNIVVMALLFALLTWGTRGRFERWMVANPTRSRALIAISVIGGGIFLVAYWGVRLYSRFGIGWFPHV